MREIRTSGSMRGRRNRALAQRACALLYRSPCLVRTVPRANQFTDSMADTFVYSRVGQLVSVEGPPRTLRNMPSH
jgi:hypothetical protein